MTYYDRSYYRSEQKVQIHAGGSWMKYIILIFTILFTSTYKANAQQVVSVKGEYSYGASKILKSTYPAE